MGYNRRVLYGRSSTECKTSSPAPPRYLFGAVLSKTCILGWIQQGLAHQPGFLKEALGEVVCDLGSAAESSGLNGTTTVNHS